MDFGSVYSLHCLQVLFSPPATYVLGCSNSNSSATLVHKKDAVCKETVVRHRQGSEMRHKYEKNINFLVQFNMVQITIVKQSKV